MSSSPWNTPTRKLSASMPRGRPIVSRPLSRCAREPIGASEPSRPVWRWIEAASRSWLQLHVRRFPGRNRMSGDRSLPLVRARTPGQWRRRTLHPNFERELAVVRTFDTIEELRAALVEFATRYNETWLVARHGYRTPAQVRAKQCQLDQNATANLKLAA